MALDLDDKILGEKVNNYISSSEDEDEGDVGAEHPEYSYGEAEYSYGEADCSQSQPSIEPVVEPPVIDRSRTSATGPKGVLEDYKRFKEMEAQKREQQREELRALTHRIAMTCRPSGEVSVLSNNEDLEFDQVSRVTTLYFMCFECILKNWLLHWLLHFVSDCST